MPKVFEAEGFRFFFYSNEGREPIHVHVEKGDGEGKIWLKPHLEAAFFVGFKEHERRKAIELDRSNQDRIEKAWNEHFQRT